MAEEMKKSSPLSLIEEEDIVLVLKKDKGVDAQLESYETVEFTKPGDNYACFVTSIEVNYKTGNRSHQTSYIAKINPQHEGLMGDMIGPACQKELGFFHDILPDLDGALAKAKEPRLRVAKFYHGNWTEGKEILYLEDLRKSGYKMHDKRSAMDKAHTDLIIKELARLHVASYIVLSQSGSETLEKKYPAALFDLMEKSMTGDAKKAFAGMFNKGIQRTIDLLKEVTGYDFAIDYFNEYIKNGKRENMLQHLKNEKMLVNVICHGDCWNNNFLFRYSMNGTPIECKLVDLQATKEQTPTWDLNHVLYTSTDGPLRRQHLDGFLSLYYSTFASALVGTQIPLTFTFPEFKKDFFAKNLVGLFYARIIVPMMLMEGEDIPKLKDFFKEGDDADAVAAKHSEATRRVLINSNLLRPRFLDVFDEMNENGLFKKRTISSHIDKFN